jgi:hypothetical protein
VFRRSAANDILVHRRGADGVDGAARALKNAARARARTGAHGGGRKTKRISVADPTVERQNGHKQQLKASVRTAGPNRVLAHCWERWHARGATPASLRAGAQPTPARTTARTAPTSPRARPPTSYPAASQPPALLRYHRARPCSILGVRECQPAHKQAPSSKQAASRGADQRLSEGGVGRAGREPAPPRRRRNRNNS